MTAFYVIMYDKRIWMKQSRLENITYLVVWGMLFVAPALSLYVRTISDTNLTYDWSEVFIVWRKFAVYLLMFLIHNFMLAPLFLDKPGNKAGRPHKRNYIVYFSTMAVILAAFAVYQCNSKPEMPKGEMSEGMRGEHKPPTERGKNLRPSPFDEHLMELDGERPPLPDDMGMPPDDHSPHNARMDNMPPPIVGERDILAIVVLILMFGANLGIKNYFRSRDDRKRLAELERENLEQQLEYLRYQINPHFFMNTLNNIHALVDIDPEKAKDTILELSKMMRFVLYEGNKQGVPLTREMDFIRHYVTLMQLRYTEKVRITLDLPTEVPDRQIPPLVLITFIENAFKHGISYQHESFVEAKVAVEGEKLRFCCRNSKADNTSTANPSLKETENKQGGVGLANVRKRLNLLYGCSYTLSIDETPEVYSVALSLPLKS